MMLNDGIEKPRPDVTVTGAASGPCANIDDPATAAQQVAVPDRVTVPPDIVADATLRPKGVAGAGEPNALPAAKALLPMLND